MTDRVKGLYVALDQDIRVDDVEPLMNAIRTLRNVSAVECEQFVTTPEDWMNRQVARSGMQSAVVEFLEKLRNGGA